MIYPQGTVDKVYKSPVLDVDNLSISCWQPVDAMHRMYRTQNSKGDMKT